MITIPDFMDKVCSFWDKRNKRTKIIILSIIGIILFIL
jgi:hypothetical protein